MVCTGGRAGLGDVCWHPAVALAQAAHCLTQISSLLQQDETTGEEKTPNSHRDFTGKEAPKKIHSPRVTFLKLSDQDKTIKLYSSVTLLICNFFRFSSVKVSLTQQSQYIC